MTDNRRMNIFNSEGMVVIEFEGGLPTGEVSLTYDVARAVAEEIAKQANGAQLKVAEDRLGGSIAEAIRGKMVTRLTHIIRDGQKKGKLPGYTAQQVVDTVFSEVFR